MNVTPEPNPGRRKTDHHDDPVLLVAESVFARDGFANSSVAAIALAAHVTEADIYAQFGSKAELYDATVRNYARAFMGILVAASESAQDFETTDLIKLAVHAWFDFVAARPAGTKLLFAEPEGRVLTVSEEVTAELTNRIAALVVRSAMRRGADASAAAPYVADMIVGLCLAAARRWVRTPTVESDAVADLVASYVIGAHDGLDTDVYARFDP